MSISKPNPERGVTPLGLAIAALILCLLASLAVPRLQAVSADRARPEGQRVLQSSAPSCSYAVMSGGCGVCHSYFVSENQRALLQELQSP